MGQTTHYRTRGPTHQPAKPSSSKKNAGNKHRLEHTKTCNQSTRSNKTIAQKDKSANTHKCCANPNHYRIGRNTSINSKIKFISATLILKTHKKMLQLPTSRLLSFNICDSHTWTNEEQAQLSFTEKPSSMRFAVMQKPMARGPAKWNQLTTSQNLFSIWQMDLRKSSSMALISNYRPEPAGKWKPLVTSVCPLFFCAIAEQAQSSRVSKLLVCWRVSLP